MNRIQVLFVTLIAIYGHETMANATVCMDLFGSKEWTDVYMSAPVSATGSGRKFSALEIRKLQRLAEDLKWTTPWVQTRNDGMRWTEGQDFKQQLFDNLTRKYDDLLKAEIEVEIIDQWNVPKIVDTVGPRPALVMWQTKILPVIFGRHQHEQIGGRQSIESVWKTYFLEWVVQYALSRDTAVKSTSVRHVYARNYSLRLLALEYLQKNLEGARTETMASSSQFGPSPYWNDVRILDIKIAIERLSNPSNVNPEFPKAFAKYQQAAETLARAIEKSESAERENDAAMVRHNWLQGAATQIKSAALQEIHAVIARLKVQIPRYSTTEKEWVDTSTSTPLYASMARAESGKFYERAVVSHETHHSGYWSEQNVSVGVTSRSLLPKQVLTVLLQNKDYVRLEREFMFALKARYDRGELPPFPKSRYFSPTLRDYPELESFMTQPMIRQYIQEAVLTVQRSMARASNDHGGLHIQATTLHDMTYDREWYK